MLGVRDMVELIDEVGLGAVRDKSVALTEYAIELADEILAPLGVTVGSPRDAAIRGGHVTLVHPKAKELTASLWTRDVIPDFREPDGVRIGLSPLSTSFQEVRRGLYAVRDELERMG